MLVLLHFSGSLAWIRWPSLRKNLRTGSVQLLEKNVLAWISETDTEKCQRWIIPDANTARKRKVIPYMLRRIGWGFATAWRSGGTPSVTLPAESSDARLNVDPRRPTF
jgi:hypothetical protein